MIVYLAINLINGKPYVGKTIHTLNRRITGYKSIIKNRKKLRYFENALKKYGLENFEFIVIDTANNEEELNGKEKFWIKYHQSYGLGYNLTPGGDGASKGQRMSLKTEFKKGMRPWNKGVPHSKETKDKISKALTGKPNPKNAKIIKEKIKEGKWESRMKGKKHTLEARRQMSEARIGKRCSPKTEFKKGQVPWNKGIPSKPETLEKMSKARRGKPNPKHSLWMLQSQANGTFRPQKLRHSEETKKKMSESRLGKRNKAIWKKVKCVETGVVYNSVTDAAKENDLFTTNIAKAINGKYKTTGGFHWEYVDKEAKNV